MQKELERFQKEIFTCPKCGWKGKESELDIENVSKKHSIFDCERPECNQQFSSGQTPSSNNSDFPKSIIQ